MNMWMLDTNAVRALVDGYSPRLDGLFGEQRCCISAIVARPANRRSGPDDWGAQPAWMPK